MFCQEGMYIKFFFFFFLKKRVNDLESERDLVGDQIALAVNQLKDTEGLLNMFNDSKKVNFHTYTPLGLGECYETQEKYFQVKVRLMYSLICFSNWLSSTSYRSVIYQLQF